MSSFSVGAPADSIDATVECSPRDVEAITTIEDHGVAGDVSPDRLYGASLVRGAQGLPKQALRRGPCPLRSCSLARPCRHDNVG